MKGRELVEMADILPLPAAQGLPAPAAPVVMALAVLLVVAAVAGLRLARPLARLRWRLGRGRVSPRAAAHELAGHLAAGTSLRGRVDRLRFGRPPPAATEVMALLEEARGRG